MGGIFSIEARDMDTKLLSAPESNNTLARCCSFGQNGLTLLQSITHDMQGLNVMHSAFPYTGTVASVVGVCVTVVVVVESSSVVKLSFVIT
ncbi:hypothetical protein Tco_1317537 [Tanacetum coccineum]